MDAVSRGFINWKDGMKISEEHFNYLQVSLEERIKDTRAANIEYYNYGILGSGLGGVSPLSIQVSIEENERVLVSVIQCRGITQAGDRIEILASSDHQEIKKVEKTLKIQESDLKRELPILIAIKVDNEAMESFGRPDPEESPLRYPYKKPALNLETLIPEADTSAIFRNSLVIGKLIVKRGEVKVDSDYIPPSTSMRSHNELKKFAFEYLDFLTSLEDHLFTILRNLATKDQLTQLAKSVGSLSERLLQSVQMNIDELKTFGPALSPAHYLLSAKRIARTIRNSLTIYTNDQKEEVLNYIKEVIDVGAGEYMGTATSVLDFEYDHLAIRSALNTINKFQSVNARLFKDWSQLDYIGKKKKTGIFVGEVKGDVESTKEKKKWDF